MSVRFPAPLFSGLLSADIAAVDALVHAQLHSDAPLVRSVGEHVMQAGGKRIRPMLLLLVAGALGYHGTQHHTLAAVIELIHTASLLHDDVVDESPLRRGLESANMRFGAAAAVLVGDFMHTRAFQLLLEVGDVSVMQVLAEATNTIAEGEVLQLMRVGDVEMSEEAYLDIAYAKTAKLFEVASALGALLCRASPDIVAKAKAYGKHFGIAFQIADDMLDYSGEEHTLGKAAGSDIREGKVTLPLIHLMRYGTFDQKELVRRYFAEGSVQDADRILHAVRHSGVLDQTYRYLLEEMARARTALDGLPTGSHADCLRQLCDFVAARQ
ncbi:MAG: polyprenyl synthetase family protein [Burkholderiaceae bacterium]|jgi:octaprenyl-diphosphate synthase|nr:polyprenyl synthetase family protein [Burkholderiaceae bacterium]